MLLSIGNWAPEWGHTFLARGRGHQYALRSLAGGSSLVVDGAAYPTPGEHSCHITLLESQAVVADYTSGTLSLFPLDAAGIPCGEPRLLHYSGHGPHPERQKGPHIHSSWLSPEGDRIVVADLGTDALYRYAVSGGCLVPESEERFSMPEGCGPRHCAFGAGVLYVATELSDEVLVLSWPGMELRQRLLVNPLRPGGGGHLVLSPDGNYLYVSSRLQGDGIATFAVKPDGSLEKCAYTPTGRHPRHFCLSPDGSMLLVACRDDNMIQFFDRSASDGSLSGSGLCLEVEKPVYIEAYEED